MSSYDALAASYDALTVDVGYRRRADYLARQFRRSAAPVETVLDLACGTGTIACLLAERGYQVVAVDGSEEMLIQAARKAAALERPPLFLHQSMPRLRLGMTVDAAVSTLDALNYLTRTADLKETLRRVCRWLRPGGLFLFDVNTPYKFRRMTARCIWTRRRTATASGGRSTLPGRRSAPIRWTCSAGPGTGPGTGHLRSTGSGPGNGRSWRHS